MSEWMDFSFIGTNLVTYLFGSYLALGLVVAILFLVIVLSAGLEIKYAFPMMLPLISLFGVAGWFGNSSWVVTAVLLVVALIYSFAMVKMFGR